MNLKNGKREKPFLTVRKRVYLSPLSVKGRFIMDFFLLLLYFFFHYSLHYLVSWNHQLSQNPPSLLSCHPQKVPAESWPIIHGQARACPSQIPSLPSRWRDKTDWWMEKWFLIMPGTGPSLLPWSMVLPHPPPFLHNSHITPLCASQNHTYPCMLFQEIFCPPSQYTGHGPPALHTSFTCRVLYLPLRKDLSL